MQKIVLELK